MPQATRYVEQFGRKRMDKTLFTVSNLLTNQQRQDIALLLHMNSLEPQKHK